jgi:hypothetical protein
MAKIDFFEWILDENGELENRVSVERDETERYVGKVPDGLIRFWRQNGRGSYYRGAYWFCDPAPFQPLIEQIFAGDPEYDPAMMTTVMYTASGELRIWHPEKKKIYVRFELQDVDNPPPSSWHSSKDGKPFSDDSIIGDLCHNSEGPFRGDENEDEFLNAAIARLGHLAPGEIYGFVPAIQLGGDYVVENLQKVRVLEHLAFLAQLKPFVLTDLTPPRPGFPYGEIVPVRQIGPQ